MLLELVALAFAERDWQTFEAMDMSRISGPASVVEKTLVAQEQDREDVASKRQEWIASQGDLDRVVFLDETWAKTNLTRTRDRSEKDSRLIEKTPCGRWSITSFPAEVRSTGFVVPPCGKRAIDGRVFDSWVRQHLVRELRPGDAPPIEPAFSRFKLLL